MEINAYLQHLKKFTWPEVFAIWRANEEASANWKAHYTERGFPSWEAWRMTFAEPLKLPSLSWDLYQVTNPLEVVPTFNGGPFRSWVKQHYHGQVQRKFQYLATLPTFQQHAGLQRLCQNFPPRTTVTGVVLNGTITIVEGMHRCLAIALAAQLNQPLQVNLCIALAQHPDATLPLVGHNPEQN